MNRIQTEVLVIGAGPGGYAAAFAAAEKGKKVILVEQNPRLGGVCLNRGCIPSKAFLHATNIIKEAESAKKIGISYPEPELDLEKLRDWKESILNRLSGGIQAMGKAKGVEVVIGRGYFEESQLLRVETENGQQYIEFESAIIAVGSKPAIPKVFDLGNPRIMTSDEALEMKDIPKDLLVVGGGYIGMELGTVYAAFGSRVVLVEAMDSILAGADPDLVAPVVRQVERAFKEVRLKTKVAKMETQGPKIAVSFEGESEATTELYDKVLISIGRVPVGNNLGLENTKVQRDDKGFIKVDPQQRTTDPSIYAIGDIVGGVMLAHKAHKEAKIAVDVISGKDRRFEDIIVPAVVFTDPEVAWAGLSESEARQKGIPVKVIRFPWSASGRALTLNHTEGVTKLIVEEETERVLGVGISGYGAGDLISEGVLAIEMGATVKDIAEVVHPHPTLSETIMECAEKFYVPKAKPTSLAR